MRDGSYLQSFVDLTLVQYVPGTRVAARLPIVVATAPICELDPNDVEDDLDAEPRGEDDLLAESVRAIYLEP